MTKYEEFLEAKKVTECTVRAIHLALGKNEKGEDNRHNDKHKFRFSLSSKSLEMGHGYYGSSSYYRLEGDAIILYVQRACNEMAHAIGVKAIALALDDLEKKRIEAQSEAREVLGECTKEVEA